MPKAVRFDQYGGIDVLDVREVPRPTPGPGEVLVHVRAAGINPGEAAIREGLMRDLWPATFPSGQGSDLAGVVEEVGPEVSGVAAGDDVIGFTNERASQAEFAVVEEGHLTPKPGGVPWEVAGALFVVGATAWAAVHAVAPQPGETVVVSGAAGGVGTLAVQLAAATGATVVGLASARHHDWLRAHGAIPIAYGDGVADRIRAAAGPGRWARSWTRSAAATSTWRSSWPCPRHRIDTIADRDAAARHGVRTDGNMVGARPEVLAELAALHRGRGGSRSRSPPRTRSTGCATPTAPSRNGTRWARSSSSPEPARTLPAGNQPNRGRSSGVCLQSSPVRGWAVPRADPRASAPPAVSVPGVTRRSYLDHASTSPLRPEAPGGDGRGARRRGRPRPHPRRGAAHAGHGRGGPRAGRRPGRCPRPARSCSPAARPRRSPPPAGAPPSGARTRWCPPSSTRPCARPRPATAR